MTFNSQHSATFPMASSQTTLRSFPIVFNPVGSSYPECLPAQVPRKPTFMGPCCPKPVVPVQAILSVIPQLDLEKETPQSLHITTHLHAPTTPGPLCRLPKILDEPFPMICGSNRQIHSGPRGHAQKKTKTDPQRQTSANRAITTMVGSTPGLLCHLLHNRSLSGV